ncbi:MAG: amidinotransferase [Candidatus Berkelbacteria bacterium]|nr:amidinotransferase [Candidatus Berkelbacteria bacterium]
MKKNEIQHVNSHNEWDPLEEVIVGTLDGATIPEWHIQLESTMPKKFWNFYKKNGGRPFPEEQIRAGKRDLNDFIKILESEGVTARRPDPIDFSRPISTPDWTARGGLYAAMPRDVLLVIGNEIIEAPMAWRSRYFESFAYRSLIKEYFKKGAGWTAVPKPQMNDSLYNYNYTEPKEEEKRYSITEFEPVFDAADFIKCGRDIFVQKSNCTNQFGIDWLERHLGNEYTIHVLEVSDTHPMHIDATFMPLAPGKLLINKERLKKIPGMFKNWDIFEAPPSCLPDSHCLYMTSKWINMNVLMLDEKRVMVEKSEERIIKSFKNWGFKPILCNFRNFNTFGGSFHCVTVDIRRRGELKSYF